MHTVLIYGAAIHHHQHILVLNLAGAVNQKPPVSESRVDLRYQLSTHLSMHVTLLRRLIFMKHQRSHLNTLPSPLMLRALIHKRRMRHPSRPSIHLAVKTLDQHYLLRRLPAQVMPPVIPVRSNRVRLPLAVGIDQRDGDQVGFGHGVGGADGQGVAGDGLDGPPDVDDLVASFQEGGGVSREVVRDAGLGGGVGLVDVDTVDGTAEVDGWFCWRRWVLIIVFVCSGERRGLSAGVFFGAADRVVEDEDAACSGSDSLSC